MRLDVTMALAATALCATIVGPTFAQDGERPAAVANSAVPSQIPVHSYRNGTKSELILRGLPLIGAATGSAQVEYHEDTARILAEVHQLPAPGALGPYTVYLLWAVSPDGGATSQGVIGGFEGGKGTLESQYGASQFALL